MKNIMIVLLFLPFLTAAQDKNGCPSENQANYNCGNIKEEILSGLKDIEFEFNSRIELELKHKIRRKKDIRKAKEVLALVSKVLNDDDFWKALEHYENYRFPKWSEKLGDTWQVIEKQEITNSFFNGNPKDSSRASIKKETIYFKLYGSSIRLPGETAVGKTEGRYICNKKWFFRRNSIKSIGSNWVHELSHIKGIRHCFNCHSDRDYSISYVINRIFLEVAEKYG